ncbi:cupin domain-containing protein [Paenibacillus rigui]|uniref:Cupin n=1 Tax=Paenibacillus rigui TaxID=554312 RepID=A0A229UIQ6_9BACL|nr:cupin domain-containing protein [Paenibacillus rigui]OXM82799.1 cupin [Paenibacillus rigui]
MKKLHIRDLAEMKGGQHILQDVLPGAYIYSGGLAFSRPGERSHTNDGPEGRDYHVHQDEELFLIVQGQGTLELNGEFTPINAGDLIVIEPGEDHHLISSAEAPLVTLYCHAGPNRHKNQQ